jgi:hypothetical protein
MNRLQLASGFENSISVRNAFGQPTISERAHVRCSNNITCWPSSCPDPANGQLLQIMKLARRVVRRSNIHFLFTLIQRPRRCLVLNRTSLSQKWLYVCYRHGPQKRRRQRNNICRISGNQYSTTRVTLGNFNQLYPCNITVDYSA